MCLTEAFDADQLVEVDLVEHLGASGRAAGAPSEFLASGAQEACRRADVSYRIQTNRTEPDRSFAMPAPFTVRLDESTLNALDHLAAKTDRSRNWLVARAIEDFVALNAWQIGKIEAGLAAAEQGAFASDKDVARVRKKFAPKT